MEREDIFRDDKLSTGKLGYSGTIQSFLNSGSVNEQVIKAMKDLKMGEKFIANNLEHILNKY